MDSHEGLHSPDSLLVPKLAGLKTPATETEENQNGPNNIESNEEFTLSEIRDKWADFMKTNPKEWGILRKILKYFQSLESLYGEFQVIQHEDEDEDDGPDLYVAEYTNVSLIKYLQTGFKVREKLADATLQEGNFKRHDWQRNFLSSESAKERQMLEDDFASMLLSSESYSSVISTCIRDINDSFQALSDAITGIREGRVYEYKRPPSK
jgi:hypothetical protein